MKAYELILILNVEPGSSAFEGEIEKVREVVTANGGKVNGVDDWGRREIAYEIKKQSHGQYTCVRFETDNGATVEELAKVLRISEAVVKFQTHRSDGVERGFKGNPLLLKKGAAEEAPAA